MAIGNIQWKGTDVCMDVWCSVCDSSFHVDGFLFNKIECPHCNTIWSADHKVKLVKTIK